MTQLVTAQQTGNSNAPLLIGWAHTDITPDKPAILGGQFYARVSEGVLDPVTATVLVLESKKDNTSTHAVMVSCDQVSICDTMRDLVRQLVHKSIPAITPEHIMINATHSHSAPDARPTSRNAIRTPQQRAQKLGIDIAPEWAGWGAEMDAMSPQAYMDFAAPRIADAVIKAWNNRQPGGISFGLSQAVVGHNRLTAYTNGKSRMYGPTDTPDFSHIEGYEDHGVNLLYTWTPTGELTGVIINLACPSQVSEHEFRISADFWHDTRLELRQRLGDNLFILPQASAAGDQSPHLIERHNKVERPNGDRSPEARMERLTGRNRRQQIAQRIADAVTSILTTMKENIDYHPAFSHHTEMLPLSRRVITQQDVDEAMAQAEPFLQQYQTLYQEMKNNPDFKNKPRWYRDITIAYRRSMRGLSVAERLEIQQHQPTMPTEIHIIRIGDMAIATNPFELYLDYGMRIKTCSVAAQTFIVQLTGSGGYLPTPRSIAGGAYGAVPASTDIGPEGGLELVDRTLELIAAQWENPAP